ncbi:MAG: glucosaminidase domain-containing protein [Campylobacterota bacterium]
MKQIVPAVMAILLIIVTYTAYLGLHDADKLDEQNSAVVETKAVEVKKPEAKKPVYKVPASTPESKRLFLENTIAAITKVKKRLDAEYQMVYELSIKTELTPDENATIEGLKKSYKVEGFPCLLKRLRTHPISIVIGQAALETGWGNSRFYREANNIFGIWSFNKNEPRMAAGEQREGQKTIYVKKYANLEASIEGYYRMMARGRAYKEFRNARLHTENPFEIIPYLDHYSELRHEYVKRLYYVIKSNKFYDLDEVQYQPPGWTNIKAAKAEYLIPKEEKPAAKVADKCKKENNETIGEDLNSSHAVDLTILSQKTESSDYKSLLIAVTCS